MPNSNRRQDDADRMVASHQGNGDADEAGAADELHLQTRRQNP